MGYFIHEYMNINRIYIASILVGTRAFCGMTNAGQSHYTTCMSYPSVLMYSNRPPGILTFRMGFSFPMDSNYIKSGYVRRR